MKCPRCDSENLKPVSIYIQNRKFRCEECDLIYSIDHYEFDYELFHPGICGRCKQSIKSNQEFCCYHVTTKDRLPSILGNGLVPNSAPLWFTNKTPYIMLSLYPYWSLFQNRPTWGLPEISQDMVILIEIKDPTIKREYFDDLEGLRWDRPIPSKYFNAIIEYKIIKHGSGQ